MRYWLPILAILISAHWVSAQSYSVLFNPLPECKLNAPKGAIALECTETGLAIRHEQSGEGWQSDTLGVFPGIRNYVQHHRTYQNAGSETAYAALYPKRKTRSAASRVKIYFPVPSDVMNPKVLLQWRPFQSARQYHVYLTDRFNQIILRKPTEDTTYQINLATLNVQKGVCYFWYVEPVSAPDSRSDEICLTWVKDEIRLLVEEEVEKINQFQGIDKATRHLMKAGLYEQHKLFIEALHEYRSACEEFPDAGDLKRMYGMFLVRIGVIKSVREVWN